ncbi:MAG: class I SAM-dependent methyltransferase [Burkholderiaceae bacterium]
MSERLLRIVEGMCLGPGDRVLEIGCGHGVAASYICERLEGGKLLALDRSAKMVAAAKKRNSVYVESGKAQFLCAAFQDHDFGKARFDKILAARVALFLEPGQRAALERLLTLRGKLFIAYDEPPAR